MQVVLIFQLSLVFSLFFSSVIQWESECGYIPPLGITSLDVSLETAPHHLQRKHFSVRTIAQSKSLPCVGLFDLMAGRKELLCDGLHLSDAGNQLLADELDKQLAALLPLETQLPDWKDKK